MAIRRFSILFEDLPAGSVIFIDLDLQSGVGPAQAELFEMDLANPQVVESQNDQSISIPVGVGCMGLVRVPIVDDQQVGTVTYRVENADGKIIRRKQHDLATLGEPRLSQGDIYVCYCIAELA